MPTYPTYLVVGYGYNFRPRGTGG